MKLKKIKQSKLILNRKEALVYFRSRSDYYNKRTKQYYCQGDNCGRLLTEEETIDDHIDNDNTNNKRTNHQPLCKGCNTHNSGKIMEQQWKIQKRRKKALESGLSKSNGTSAQLIINNAAEKPFRDWVLNKVETYDSISWIDLLDAGCEYVTQKFVPLSQSTADRYLRKLTSFEGPLITIGTGDARQVELRNKNKSTNKDNAGPS